MKINTVTADLLGLCDGRRSVQTIVELMAAELGPSIEAGALATVDRLRELGVIGLRKFVFDIWGDSVNTASRMESHGVPGRIQLSDATYELIRDEFNCEPRGTIEVKGKGPMRTWFLVGERRAPESARSDVARGERSVRVPASGP